MIKFERIEKIKPTKKQFSNETCQFWLIFESMNESGALIHISMVSYRWGRGERGGEPKSFGGH